MSIVDQGARRAYDRSRYSARREIILARAKKWRIDHPEKVRTRDLKRGYGMTVDEFDALLKTQNGCCAICGLPPRGKSKRTQVLHVDHDHARNVVRALLCADCNKAIGLLHEDPERCLAAAIYLKEHKPIRLVV
jgi:hypothetical protein